MIEASKNPAASRSIRYGMVGGGSGAFIGEVHRKAIGLDGMATLASGCFSRDMANTLATGSALGIAESRCYQDFETMAAAEGMRPDGIDFVVIVTPNALHYPIAKAFLAQGINVVCDKPLTFEVAEAEELAALAKRKDLLFCTTYTYSGYPAVKQAREMVKKGEIGDIRFVSAEYPQEWLATPAEKQGSKQASWRTDPKQAGRSNCVGDIGSHVENTVSCITGLQIESLCARLDSFVAGRTLDDNASIMVNYKGGAKGLYWSSQIAIGYDNALRVRVFGTTGTIQWSQENPNYLIVSKLGQPTVTLSRGRDPFHARAQAYSRIPSGHPEGYFEAFANLYRTYIAALVKKASGAALGPEDLDFPNADDGIRGVRFIGKCVESSRKGAVWLDF